MRASGRFSYCSYGAGDCVCAGATGRGTARQRRCSKSSQSQCRRSCAFQPQTIHVTDEKGVQRNTAECRSLRFCRRPGAARKDMKDRICVGVIARAATLPRAVLARGVHPTSATALSCCRSRDGKPLTAAKADEDHRSRRQATRAMDSRRRCAGSLQRALTSTGTGSASLHSQVSAPRCDRSGPRVDILRFDDCRYRPAEFYRANRRRFPRARESGCIPDRRR